MHVDSNGQELPSVITSKTAPIVNGVLHPTTLAQKSIQPV